MLSLLLSPFQKKPRAKNFLLLLLEEIRTNLERYYVIDQRQFINVGFEIRAWEEAKHLSGRTFPSAITDYALAIEDFNALLEDVRSFEKDYVLDVSRQSRESAQILHDKKEALESKFYALQPRIMAAQKALRVIMDKRSHA